MEKGALTRFPANQFSEFVWDPHMRTWVMFLTRDAYIRTPICRLLATILLLFLAPLAGIEAQTGTGVWRQLAVPASPGMAYSFIDFSDSLHGWVMSPDRFFSLTTDGGQTWRGPHMVGDSGAVRSMKWLGGDTGVVAVDVGLSLDSKSRLLRTTDRGQSWISSLAAAGKPFNSLVSLVNRSLIGYVALGRERGDVWLCTSTDLGTTWRVDSLPDGRLRKTKDFGILSADRMIFCSGFGGMIGDGMIVRSADFGKTCSTMVSPPDLTSSEGRFMSAELSYFSYSRGDDIPWPGSFAYNAVLDRAVSIPIWSMGALFRDLTVFSVPKNASMTARTLDPLDSTYTVGPYISINGHLVDLCMISPACGWLLDGRGRVFRRADLLTAVPGHRSIVPERFILLQNYPNPFNPSTTVRYELPSAGEVDLRVTDVLGREVYRSVESQSAGVKTKAIDLSRCASGVYYCTVRFGGRAQTIKMALAR